jgi:dipeptidyl aminopeptidase/acylaminoacyl peptidase
MVPVLQLFGLWVDEARETSSLNSGSLWISTDAIYDMTPAIDRAVSPTIAWVGNDGRILYNTNQRHGRSTLWLRVPRESAPRFVASDAGPASVLLADQSVYFVRSGDTPGLYRTTLAGTEPTRVVDGRISHPAVSRDGRIVTFVRPLFSGYTLWAVSAGGGEPYQLTPTVAQSIPLVSPDLKRIAIQQGDEVLMCDLPGCGNQDTLPVTSLLGWTPDCLGLVHKGPPSTSNIWVTRIADGTLHQITKFGDETVTSIGWSADGHRVAVTASEPSAISTGSAFSAAN